MIINDKIHGQIQITDPLAIEIINTKAMQRLKGVCQYSTLQFLSSKYNTTRFDHCLGVYFLLKKLNAPYEEQIAGLIHDVSHFAFSHLIDFVYDRGHTQDVHEEFHEKIIMDSEIPDLLKKHNLNLSYILEEKNFPLLEREIPDLCADRMDYFIRDSFTTELIDAKKAIEYLNALTLFNNEIVIKNQALAKEIAENFMKMNLNFWGNSFIAATLNIGADALKIALKNNIITEKDFFLTDKELTQKLISSNNKEILEKLEIIKDSNNFQQGTPKDHDLHKTTKARFIDPKFIQDGELLTLSDVDQEFKQKLENFKKIYEKGYYIKVIK